MKNHGGGTVGDYKGPAATSTTIRGSYMRTESAGVEHGLSHRMKLSSEHHGYSGGDENYDVDSMTGNANERPKRYGSKMVSNKGHSFDIC